MELTIDFPLTTGQWHWLQRALEGWGWAREDSGGEKKERVRKREWERRENTLLLTAAGLEGLCVRGRSAFEKRCVTVPHTNNSGVYWTAEQGEMEEQWANLYPWVVINHNIEEDLTAMFVRMHLSIIRTTDIIYSFINYTKRAVFSRFTRLITKKYIYIYCV